MVLTSLPVPYLEQVYSVVSSLLRSGIETVVSNMKAGRQCQTSDEYTFAQWAFSADGLPNLQFLALGDFSFEGPYSEYNVLLCRSDGGYQRLTRTDVQAWDIIQNNMDTIAACN